MPYVGQPFGKIQVGEKRTFSIDTAKDIPPGDALASAAWTCTVYGDGIDPNAASYVLVSSYAGTVGLVSFQARGPGITYELKLTGTTAADEIIILWSVVEVLADGMG